MAESNESQGIESMPCSEIEYRGEPICLGQMRLQKEVLKTN